MRSKQELEIINFIKTKGESSSKEIFDNLTLGISYATLKRNLTKLITEKSIESLGKGKSTKYIISSAYELLESINLDKYYEKEIDERNIKENFNLDVITNTLDKQSVFTNRELEKLQSLQNDYKKNIEQLSKTEYKKELDRLAIDLSWKSSQIEGNTYSLLETERLK